MRTILNPQLPFWGSADYWELLKTVLPNPPLGCGIPWHLTKSLCCAGAPCPARDLFDPDCFQTGIVPFYAALWLAGEQSHNFVRLQ